MALRGWASLSVSLGITEQRMKSSTSNIWCQEWVVLSLKIESSSGVNEGVWNSLGNEYTADPCWWKERVDVLLIQERTPTTVTPFSTVFSCWLKLPGLRKLWLKITSEAGFFLPVPIFSSSLAWPHTETLDKDTCAFRLAQAIVLESAWVAGLWKWEGVRNRAFLVWALRKEGRGLGEAFSV